MTHHDIVTELRPRRLHSRLTLYAIVAPIGAGAAVFDHTTGGSAGRLIAIVGFAIWRFWPARR